MWEPDRGRGHVPKDWSALLWLEGVVEDGAVLVQRGEWDGPWSDKPRDGGAGRAVSEFRASERKAGVCYLFGYASCCVEFVVWSMTTQ